MTTPQSLITRLASPDATGRTEADIQSDIKTLLTTADFDLDTPRLRLPSFSGHPICTDPVSVGEDVHCESTAQEVHAGVPA